MYDIIFNLMVTHGERTQYSMLNIKKINKCNGENTEKRLGQYQ